MRARLLFAAAAMSAVSGAAAQEPAKARFGAARDAAPGAPAAVGEYAKGCLIGGAELDPFGAGWQTMRPSRNRAWGHPEALAFVERLGAAAQALGWPGVMIGDISQPRGGPMTSGHASHQLGLDIDVWLARPDTARLSQVDRELLGATNMVGGDRRRVSAAWTEDHARILKAAASDPATARIFVNAAIKAELCRRAEDDRAWLGKVRPWWGHDHHFHVRLACPGASPACVDQPPPPPGDGCDAALDWWFSDEALNPKPSAPATPRRDIAMDELPAVCAAVAAAP